MLACTFNKLVVLLWHSRLFEEHPDVKAKFYFSMENSLDLDATMRDERMGKHAKGVIDTISVAVSLLQDLPTLVPILIQLGGSHAKFNLQDEHFKVNVPFILNIFIYFISSSVVNMQAKKFIFTSLCISCFI